MPPPLSRQGSASALQARSRLSQLLCSEARAPRDDHIGELFRCGAVAKMGVEAFAVYACLVSRHPSERLTTEDIAVATGLSEVSVESALQALLQSETQGGYLARGVASRIDDTTKRHLDRTKQPI